MLWENHYLKFASWEAIGGPEKYLKFDQLNFLLEIKLRILIQFLIYTETGLSTKCYVFFIVTRESN